MTMNRRHRFLLVVLLSGVCIILYLAVVSPYLQQLNASKAARSIDIPKREQAYRTLQPMVIRSEEQWQTHLAHLKSTEIVFALYKEDNRWGQWLDFEKAIRDANIAYPQEVLVIVPSVKGASSIEPRIDLRLSLRRLVFKILPVDMTGKVGMPAFSYACYAFAVKADQVDQFEVRVDGRTTATIDLK